MFSCEFFANFLEHLFYRTPAVAASWFGRDKSLGALYGIFDIKIAFTCLLSLPMKTKIEKI